MKPRNIVRKYGARIAAVPAVLAVSAGAAMAAVPAGATAAFTALETDGTAMIDLGWPVVTALTVGIILIGIFKKVASKSAS